MALRRILRSTQQYLERVKDPTPPTEHLLYSFSKPAELKLWETFSDKELGGVSTAALTAFEGHEGTAKFAGNFSTDIADEGSRVQRSGFCGMHTTVEGEGEYIDLSEYDTISYRVYGDGRKYIANFRTENWIVGTKNHDVWQAFLFARKGAWTDVDIPLDRFLLTWKGRLVESKMELSPQRIISLGISLAGGEKLQHHGDFSLGLHSISAKRLE